METERPVRGVGGRGGAVSGEGGVFRQDRARPRPQRSSAKIRVDDYFWGPTGGPGAICRKEGEGGARGGGLGSVGPAGGGGGARGGGGGGGGAGGGGGGGLGSQARTIKKVSTKMSM